MTERVSPHSLMAERAILGTILAYPERWPDLAGKVEASEFFRVAHQHLFRTFETLIATGIPIDLVTLRDRLTKDGLLEAVDGLAYVSGLADGVARSTNLEHYAQIVRDAATLRGVIATAETMLADAYDADAEATTVLGRAEAALHGVAQRSTKGDVWSPAAFADEGHQAVEALIDRGGASLGVGTGFRDLDRALLGWQPAELIYLAARPSVGKTAFALNSAWAAAARGETVVFFSTEMSRRDVYFRLMAQIAQLDGHRLKSGHASANELRLLGDAYTQVRESGFWIDDTSMPTVEEIHNKARRVQASQGLAMVVVDYMQILRLPAGETQHLRVSSASIRLRHAARDLKVPFLVLSQLSRKVEERGGDRRPMLSDLRESGSLEQDADVVIFLHRPEVYQRTAENHGLAEAIIGKQRNGPTGTVPLTWIAEQTRFADQARGLAREA